VFNTITNIECDGSRFIAVGDFGSMAYSSDGLSWTDETYHTQWLNLTTSNIATSVVVFKRLANGIFYYINNQSKGFTFNEGYTGLWGLNVPISLTNTNDIVPATAKSSLLLKKNGVYYTTPD
jgi:hypothetical protein